MSPGPPKGGHLTDKSLAAFLDRRLPDGERDRLEGHLAGCQECRTRLLAATATLQGERKRNTLRAAAGGAAGIAVVVGLFLVSPFSPGPDAPRIRGGDPSSMGGSRSLQVVSPPDGATIMADSILLIWSSLEPAARYRVTVTDPEFRTVWERDVDDTVTVAPVTALTPGETFLWYVDALLPDGTPATTGVHRFSVQR